MRKMRKMIMTGIALGASAIAFVYWNYRKKVSDVTESEGDNIDQEIPEPETVEQMFVREWSTVFMENGHTFNGLFNGLLRVQSGTAKKPEKTLREWCQRTHYKFENSAVDILCQENIQPLIKIEKRDELKKWAILLLEAAAEAGITKESAAKVVLSESSANDYVEWDSCELYPDDQVEVITPAWYQNGKLLEQGQCRKLTFEA